MRFRLILVSAGVLALGALVIFWLFSNPPYTVEVRHADEAGTVTYEWQPYELWNHSANIAGLRRHTRDIIYHSVYFDGLQYCFSHTGHVYAMAGAENDDPSYFDREWTWAGDPHQFPHYDYSKVSPYVRP